MPEAIATSRRRFYKVLESLSTSSLATEAPSTTSTKRSSAAAFDEARERVRKRLRHSTSSGSLSTFDDHPAVISLPRKTIPKSTPTRNGPPPNFSPWSQETFLARLKTFSSVTQWHPKPDAINEVEWAKRGWLCVDVNTVGCKGGCERRVVVSLSKGRVDKDEESQGQQEKDEEDQEVKSLEKALVDRYRRMIVDGHSSSCLWYKAGCKDDIYRLQVVRPSVWQSELRKRFQSFAKIEESIRDIKLRPLDDSNTKLIHDLPQEILGLHEPPTGTADVPFEIAMHGWRGSSDSGTHLLNCDACFQRIGLWMYQPGYRQSRANADEDETEEDDSLIDLVEMHRDHCPWRNPVTQNATGSLGGLNACQILQRVVATAARDYRRKSNMQINKQADDVEQEPTTPQTPDKVSREEVARQDIERESRLRKLKNLFNIKRRPTTKAAVQKTA